MRMRFYLDPLSKAFSHCSGLAENAQRLSVNRRPIHIEIYAVSNENGLVWTGREQSSCYNATIKTFILPTVVLAYDIKLKLELICVLVGESKINLR